MIHSRLEFLPVHGFCIQSFLPRTPLRSHPLFYQGPRCDAMQLLLASSPRFDRLDSASHSPLFPRLFIISPVISILRGQSRPPTLFAPVPSNTVVSSDSNSSASLFFYPSPLPSFSFVFFSPSTTRGLFVRTRIFT